MATYTDNFNRADGPLTAPWADVDGAGLDIISNELRAGGGGQNISALTGETFANDQQATIEVTVVQGYDFGGVAVRMNGSGDGYVGMAEFGDGRFYCYRIDAGVWTSLGFRSETFVVTDTIGIGIVGSTITLYKNDVAVGATFSDSTHTSGVAGVAYNLGDSNVTRLDNFSATGWDSDSIGSIDDPVLDGETGNAFTYSGFASGDPDTFTLDGVTVSGSATTGAGTWDNVDIAALDTDDSGQVVPQFGTVTFEASNGTESASTTTTLNVKAGWTNTVVASIDTVTASYLYQLITTQLPTLPAPANGDTWYYPTADSTVISAAGGITTDLSTFTFQYIHDVAGTLTAYTITWSNGSLSIGTITATDISADVISSSAISSSTI